MCRRNRETLQGKFISKVCGSAMTSQFRNALYVTVYASKRQAEKGKQMFSFSYLPEDSDETYNIVNDSDKFMLKLEK